jgi:Uncharacterized protein conserved in bacteria
MNYRIIDKNEFYIIGFKKRIALVFNGINPQVTSLYEKLMPEIISELKSKNDIEPAGFLSVSANFSDRTKEGSELDQYVGIASSKPYEADSSNSGSNRNYYDCLYVKPQTWVVFLVCGKFPDALQETWARIYSEWIVSSDYELCDGPEILWNESPDTSKPDYKSEIWIPIVKKEI